MAERQATSSLNVQVCYAMADVQLLIELVMPAGTTIEQAIRQSGIQERAPEIDLMVSKVGVFGKIKPLDTPLRDHDRVEIYRPLAIDPKEARRLRARRQSGG